MNLLSGLTVYGPLGVWALAATAAVMYLYRDNGKLRDSHTAAITKSNDAFVAKLDAVAAAHASALAAQANEFAAQVRDLGAEHAAALVAQAERYNRQITDAHDRMLAIESNLIDKLAGMADAISRSRSR